MKIHVTIDAPECPYWNYANHTATHTCNGCYCLTGDYSLGTEAIGIMIMGDRYCLIDATVLGKKVGEIGSKCSCYHTQKEKRYTFNMFTGQQISRDVEVGVCWGTREKDKCSCGGDASKCDFYPEKRRVSE